MREKEKFYVYELNTRLWLRELANKYQRKVRLDNIPDEEIASFKEWGFDYLWLMGVWSSTQEVRKAIFRDPKLLAELKSALPDLTSEDIVSSPYSINEYKIDASLGSQEGLLYFKEKLNRYGMKLILDFVPNHVALDHPWVKKNPEFFINGTTEDLEKNPELFFRPDNSRAILAYGKDPYFPAWKDVAQLNYFNPSTHKAMQEVLFDIAPFCDGLRCDMAMLILMRIQKEIWGERVFNGNKFNEPETEFWQEAIRGIRKVSPDFIFIAEVYWGLEHELVSLGFDYVYDKALYDALRDGDVERVRRYLLEDDGVRYNRLSFIENHDEGRALAVFGLQKSKAAALIMLLMPGMYLFHQGQFEGFREKVPLRLIRRPNEEVNPQVCSFYRKLLSEMKDIIQYNNHWTVLEPSSAWEGNTTDKNFLYVINSQYYLAVINYSTVQSQCYVHFDTFAAPNRILSGHGIEAPLSINPEHTLAFRPESRRVDLGGLKAKNVLFKDLLGSAEYVRNSQEISSRGLYLDMPAYGFHLFRISGMD